MSVLTARFVRKPRRWCVCDWCERTITGPHIYLYGSGDTERPWALRLHLTGSCRPHDKDPKVQAALAVADKESEVQRV